MSNELDRLREALREYRLFGSYRQSAWDVEILAAAAAKHLAMLEAGNNADSDLRSTRLLCISDGSSTRRLLDTTDQFSTKPATITVNGDDIYQLVRGFYIGNSPMVTDAVEALAYAFNQTSDRCEVGSGGG